MKVTNRFDLALIGNSYLVQFLQLLLLKRGCRTIILDDPRFGPGDAQICEFGELEKELIKSWGDSIGSPTMVNIEQYLVPQELVFRVPGKFPREIRLGGSSSRNIKEFFRKCGDFWPLHNDFSRELMEQVLSVDGAREFDKEFLGSAQRLGRDLSQFKNRSRFSCEEIDTFLSPSVLGMWKVFKNVFKNTLDLKHSAARNFILLLNSFYRFHLGIPETDEDLFTLFFAAFSPFYRLDRKALERDLLTEVDQYDGFIRQTTIKDLLYYRQRDWEIELDSVEGVIKVQDMVVTGPHFPLYSPFSPRHQFQEQVQGRRGVRANLLLDRPLDKNWAGAQIVFGQVEKNTQNFSYWQGSFHGPKVSLLLPFVCRPGTKLRFYSEQIWNYLYRELDQYLGIRRSNVRVEELYWSKEYWTLGTVPRRQKWSRFLPSSNSNKVRTQLPREGKALEVLLEFKERAPFL